MDSLRLTAPSCSTTLSLNEVIARLSSHPTVESVLLMGSTGQSSFTATSDYDLLVVMTTLPEPLALVHTTIDQRLAEVYVVASTTLDPLLDSASSTVTGGALPQNGDHVALYTWMQTGQIVWDQTGRLARVQHILQTSAWFTPAPEAQRYRIWFGANYNLHHTQWIAASTDPRYQREVDVRLLFTVYFLLCDYFHLRGLPWGGSKAAMRWLAQHDAAYLDLFEAFLDTPSRDRKLTLYAQLVEQTVAPFGPVWNNQATAMQFAADADVTPKRIERAFAWWETLLSNNTAHE